MPNHGNSRKTPAVRRPRRSAWRAVPDNVGARDQQCRVEH
jgi:hypothetical protein